MVKANADSVEIHRWYIDLDPEPWYVVNWENSFGYRASDLEEKERKFRTLEGAFKWARRILTAKVDED